MVWTTRGQGVPRGTHFVLYFNRRPAPLSLMQLGREAQLNSEAAVIASCIEPASFCYADAHDYVAIAIDQQRLREFVGQVEDLVASQCLASPALRYLRRYVEILPSRKEAEAEPDLLAHIGTALTDLVALALAAGRDAAEFAKMRGLHAARQHEIIREIRARFADPDFSAQQLAVRMGVTDRYVQDLLHESGSSFSQRVLELRLQCARAMLQDCRYDLLDINEVANASGFNAIPYFNRCFRRRFGTKPSHCSGQAVR